MATTMPDSANGAVKDRSTRFLARFTAAPGVTPEKYDTVRETILRALPYHEFGTTWDQLVQAVAPDLPSGLSPHLGTVR